MQHQPSSFTALGPPVAVASLPRKRFHFGYLLNGCSVAGKFCPGCRLQSALYRLILVNDPISCLCNGTISSARPQPASDSHSPCRRAPIVHEFFQISVDGVNPRDQVLHRTSDSGWTSM
jgi:hypothetical protein